MDPINDDFKRVCKKMQHVDELIEACLNMDIVTYSDNPDDWRKAWEDIRIVLRAMGVDLNGDDNETDT
jgi:hypothetical protein